jgi:hypothetical protein
VPQLYSAVDHGFDSATSQHATLTVIDGYHAFVSLVQSSLMSPRFVKSMPWRRQEASKSLLGTPWSCR